MLSADELTAMRATAGLALPDTGVISRANTASDGMGGITDTPRTTVDTVSCRFDAPGNIRLDQWSEKIMNRSVFILNTEEGTDIQSGDQVVSGGVTYLVVGILSGSWEITRRAVVVML